MLPLLSEANFNSIALIVIACIGIVPTTLAALYSRQAKHSSEQAKHNSAGALHEVKANGGMSDPDPTLKDYIKFVGENIEHQGRRMDRLEEVVNNHLEESSVLSTAFAELYLEIKQQQRKQHVPDAS